MRGCLFTLLLGAVAIVLIVTIGLPKVAAGILTSAVTAAGLQAADTTVTVTSDPPTDLLGLHADVVRVHATHATFRGTRIGTLDVELDDVAILSRTAGRVRGRLQGVTLSGVGGGDLTLPEIALSGAGSQVTASTQLAAAEARRLIADGLEGRIGSPPSSVTLTAPDRLAVTVSGLTVEGTLAVSATGDLVVRPAKNPAGIGDIVLLRGGTDLPIRLTRVAVSPGGDVVLTGDLAVGLLG